MILWLIGLSGAGKSTLGRVIHRRWRELTPNVVLVDGDEIRSIFKHDRGPDAYSLEGRRQNAERICELCAWLDRQGIHVVCSILSVFESSRRWNREHFSNYFEVFLDVPLDVLRRRDPRGLYAKAYEGREQNVVGVDLPFERPQRSDLVIDNSSEGLDAEAVGAQILARALATQASGVAYPYAEGDRVAERNSYQYTPYLGRPFLEAWRLSRSDARSGLPPPIAPPDGTSRPTPAELISRVQAGEVVGTGVLLDALYGRLRSDPVEGELEFFVEQLIQRFEVSKRIHGAYGGRFRPVDREDHHDLRLYVRAAEVFEAVYVRREDLPALNALLKALDTLVSVRARLAPDLGARLARLLEREEEHVRRLGDRQGVVL